MKQRRETILIHGGRVYQHDGDTDQPITADVLIEGGVIRRIEPNLFAASERGELGAIERVIDAREKLLMPGFFNAHYHSHDTLQKGCFETPSLDDWASIAMPHAYPRRSAEELRVRTLVGAIECIRTGMTTIQDMAGLYPFDQGDLDVILDTYNEIGLRCVFAPQFGNIGRSQVRPFYEELIGADERWRLTGPNRQFPPETDIVATIEEAIVSRQGKREMIHFALGPNSPEGCTRELWEGIGDLSRRRNLPIYTHLYENKGMTHIARTKYREWGGSLIKFLDALGVLGSRLSFAHSVWLLPEEIELLGRTGTNVVLNPIGNLKTRSGIAPARAFMKAGVNIGLGCDNCSCSDVQNMFQSMKLHTVLAGVVDPEEGPPFAAHAIRAATLGGAQTAGLSDLGSLAPGMRADVTILDLTDISFVPLNSVARQVVYTEAGRAVETVIVDGCVIMLDRKILTIDEAALRREVRGLMPKLLKDLEEIKGRLSPIQPMIDAAQKRTWDTDIGTDRFVRGR
jgi:guanine deaminase